MWQTHGMDKQIPNRYLLCRPEGGLNDILSEIGKCIAYGKKFGRCVIVETNSHAHHHFRDVFGNYFNSQNKNLLLDSHPIAKGFDAMAALPSYLSGQINLYKKDVLATQGYSGALSFDFSKDYSEELLVHHANGQQKHRNALIALSQMTLHQSLLEGLALRLTVLGASYHAFHIRHTDYQTDFKSKVLALAPQILDRVFLATDNKSVVDYFEDVFGKNRLTTFSQLPDQIGAPLHYGNIGSEVSNRNCDAILDLMTLSLADKCSIFPREHVGRRFFSPYSGFSSLAARLRLAPHIMRNLLPREFHGRIKVPRLLEKAQNIRWLYF